jgi:hypothetical protein
MHVQALALDALGPRDASRATQYPPFSHCPIGASGGMLIGNSRGDGRHELR